MEESFSPVSLRDGLSPRDGLSARRKTSPELLETHVKEPTDIDSFGLVVVAAASIAAAAAAVLLLLLPLIRLLS